MIIVLTFDDSMLSLDLCDIKRSNIQTGLFFDTSLNFGIGCFDFGFCDVHFSRVNSNPDNIIRLLFR